MPLQIKELFLEIIKYYYKNNTSDITSNINEFNTLYQYIPMIIQFNRISKIHYEWCKNITTNNIITEIKYSLIWLNVQKLRKTINFNHDVHCYIQDWVGISSSQTSLGLAVLLYNKLNSRKIIGNYPYYNIWYKFIYPDPVPIKSYSDEYASDYKNFPKIKEIMYYNNELYNCKTHNKLNKKELQLLKDKPYMFKFKYNLIIS